MNNNDWLKSFGLADEKYVNEAVPANEGRSVKITAQNERVKRRRRWLAPALAASCAALAITASSLYLFLPYDTSMPDVSRYASNEYYPVIQKLNEYTYEKPKYANNFQKITAGIGGIFDRKNGASGDMFPSDDAAFPPAADAPQQGPDGDVGEADGSQHYNEITDNQVAGVTESDRIKRSDKYIYYFWANELRVYSFGGGEVELAGSYEMSFGDKIGVDYNRAEFYLSNDCSTVTVVCPYNIYDGDDRGAYVGVRSLDVTNPANITQKASFSITGGYGSSRMTGGSLLLITEFAFYKNAIDFDRPETYVPRYDTGDGLTLIEGDGIVCPENLTSSRYTQITKLDEKTLAYDGSAAYLSYSNEAYVTENRVYLTCGYTDREKQDDGIVKYTAKTTISCVEYGGDNFNILKGTEVEGRVKDRFSLDEYDGKLRVVTTTNTYYQREYNYGDHAAVAPDVLPTGSTNANLYCIDSNLWEEVAKLVAFAPWGEQVRSVRFDKNTAYVCTSIQVTDPVFFIDLSDLSDIKIKDTGEIKGFSTSLISFGDGYLVGIGRGEMSGTLKVEVYEERGDEVVSVASYEIEAGYPDEYKAYYIDREHGFIGMGIKDYEDGYSDKYLFLSFDGYTIKELCRLDMEGDYSLFRGVYVDGYLYAFGSNTAVGNILGK